MKAYNNLNVYEASQERLKFVFENFERVYVSFSGGKDSGVLLNLVIDYVRKNNLAKKVGVQIMDNEAGFFRIRSFRCWTLLKEAKFEFPPVPLSR